MGSAEGPGDQLTGQEGVRLGQQHISMLLIVSLFLGGLGEREHVVLENNFEFVQSCKVLAGL